MDKQLIKQRFSRAIHTYDDTAHIQQDIAEHLSILIQKYAQDTSCHQLFEIGCGTGNLSLLMQQILQPQHYVLNDICDDVEMELMNKLKGTTATSVHFSFRAGDAEAIDYPTPLDMITSCSAIQWFERPQSFFDKCASALKQGGLLCLSSFGKENMKEISSLTGQGLTYLSLNELQEMLSSHFDILHIEEDLVTMDFDTPYNVLKHLQSTGVTGTSDYVWTPQKFRHFCKEYIRRYTNSDGKVALSYHPIYIIAQKR